MSEKLRGTLAVDNVLKAVISSDGVLTGRLTTSLSNDFLGEAIVLVDDTGREVVAVLTEEPVTLTATPNDIRFGTTAVTELGLIKGTKVIPAYYTSEGMQVIMPGKNFEIKTLGEDAIFTKLQALFCSSSVITDKVCINTKVYPTGSKEALSIVSVDADNLIINFGITNDTAVPYVIRYFMYREEY